MKMEKRIIALNPYEHGVVINALNDMRNELIEEDRPRIWWMRYFSKP